MQITVKNPLSTSDEKSMELAFPLSDWELSENMQAIGIADTIPKAVLLRVAEENSFLDSLLHKEINLDELNFFAKRLESLTEYEQKKLAACCEVRRIDNLQDMINMTYSLAGVSLIDDYKDLQAMGRRIYLDIHGGVSAEEMETLDAGAFARNYLKQTKGIATIYGTLLPDTFSIEQVYDGQIFPEFYSDSHTVMGITIQNQDGQREHIYLPTNLSSMDKVKERLGVSWFSECEVLEIQSMRLPEELTAHTKIESIDDLTLLNDLCLAVSDFSDNEMLRFQMAAAYAGVKNLTGLRKLAEHLDLFAALPGIHNDVEYGKYVICDVGLYSIDDTLLPFIDYEAFGKNERETTMAESKYVSQGLVGVTEPVNWVKHHAVRESRTLEIIEGLEKFRLYSPLCGRFYQEDDSDCAEISGDDLADYREEIKKKIDTQIFDDEKTRGLMRYFSGEPTVSKKVYSAFPAVEWYEGTLYGVLECRITEPLMDEELTGLKEFWLGQMSDGWGEGFEQQAIKTGDGELYVSFWNPGEDYRIVTESELKHMGEIQEEQGRGINLSM